MFGVPKIISQHETQKQKLDLVQSHPKFEKLTCRIGRWTEVGNTMSLGTTGGLTMSLGTTGGFRVIRDGLRTINDTVLVTDERNPFSMCPTEHTTNLVVV
jgi:hypothetical protein